MKDIPPDEALPNSGTSSMSWLIVGWASLPGWLLLMTSGIWFRGDADQDATWWTEGVPKLLSGGLLIGRQHTFWVLLACWDNPLGVNTLLHPWHQTCMGIMLYYKVPRMEMECRDEGKKLKWVTKVKICKGKKTIWVSVCQWLAIYKGTYQFSESSSLSCHFSVFS